MEPPDDIRDLCKAFADGHEAALGAKLFGVYLYGAVAFPESGAMGDIDFHVILKEALTDAERTELYDLHASLARDFPPLGVDMDGYYILLKDARQKSPPRSQMWSCATDGAWALHREHIRAGRCIVLHGPDPKEVYPPASWPELEEALRRELKYVEDHLRDYPDYCILNLCRLMYSFETKEVVISKMGAAGWAWEVFPRWRRHIELARESYPGRGRPEAREFMVTQVEDFYRFACERIREGPRR